MTVLVTTDYVVVIDTVAFTNSIICDYSRNKRASGLV
jgi:hypothetical protein